MKKSFYIVHSMVMAIAIGVILIVSMFYIGSKDQLEEVLLNNLWPFLSGKFVVNLIILLIAVGILGLVNLIFKQKINRKLRVRALIMEFLILLVVAIVIIPIAVFYLS